MDIHLLLSIPPPQQEFWVAYLLSVGSIGSYKPYWECDLRILINLVVVHRERLFVAQNREGRSSVNMRLQDAKSVANRK